MKIRFLQIQRVLQTALFVALLSVVAMTKAQTENITFADANVKAICVANWDADGDGELNTTEAAAVTSLDGVFMFDGDIISFNELQLFTGLTSFGEDEFNSCTNLAAITIPNAVTSIGGYAFSDCSSLTSITSYACTPPTLGSNVFDNVPSAVVLNVPCHAAALYQAADGWSDFSNYEEFEYGLCPIVFVDDNVKAICVAHWDTNGDGELSYTEAAEVTNLGTYFKSTAITSFEELEYFTSLTSLPNTAFYGCTSLTSITLPSSISALGNGSFYNCTSLATMTVYAETPPTVGTNAFKNVPTTMVVQVLCEAYDAYHTASGWSEFANIQGFGPLCPITFADANVKALCVANWDTDNDGELSYAEAAAVTDLGQVFRSKNTITSFNELQYFTGLTSIGHWDFSYCTSLTSIELPNSVTSIGINAFYYCTGLTSIEIPNSVISIGSDAFYYCTGLTSIEIPNSVTWIGTNPFSACRGLEQIVVASDNAYYDSRENCNAIINTSTNELVTGCKNTVIPNSVTSIGGDAFYYCTGLTSVTIGNSVNTIGSSAFAHCNRLNSITVLAETPPSLYFHVNNNSFYSFYSVPKNIPVFVPCDAIEVYQAARGWCDFTNIIGLCSGEVSVTVNPSEGGTVTGDGYYTSGEICVLTATPNEGFSFINWTENGRVLSMDSVCSFYAHPTTIMANFCSNSPIVFADTTVKALCVANWDTNGDGELSYAEAARVTDLGEVFKNDSTITSFNELQHFINLTTINSYAFSNCTGLSSVAIGSSVSRIENYAFSNCNRLNSMTVLAETPPALNYSYGDSQFSNVPKDIPVYVPCNAVEEYQAKRGWSNFTNIIGLCSGEVSVTVYPSGGGTVTGTGYYTGGELCVLTATPNEGYSFLNWMENRRVVSMDSVYTFPAHPTTIMANFCSHSPIVFADSTVKALCVANWDTNGDGELSYAEAARVTSLGEVFKNNSSISSFNELQYFIGLTSIDEEAFSHCSNLTSIEIPYTVSYIGSDAFFYCSGLTSITVWADNPPFLQGIVPIDDWKEGWVGGGWVFDGVDEAIPVYVPCDAVEAYQNDYDWNLFTNIIGMCSGQVVVTVNASEGGTVTGGGYYDGGDICVLTATPNPGFDFINWTENGCVVSRDSVYSFHAHPTTIIANFYSNSPIVFADTTVKALCVANWDTNGDSELSYAEAAEVTDLGVVFKNNSSISSFNELQYFTSLVSINNETFSLCSNLTSIEMPNSVISIGYRAFYGCSGLTSIEIPNAVTSINNLAFYSCSGLEQMIVDSGNTVYDSRENCNAIIETETNELVIGCKNTIIPNSVTSIGSDAFYYCSGLTSIEIPNSVTSIGDWAFGNCTSLASIEIPNSVISIGDWAFRNCTSLTSIEIPNSVTSISGAMFYGCSSLTSIEIPNSVTSIGGSAFYGCRGLTSIEIPNSLTSIGNYAFYGCSGLTLMTLWVDNPPALGNNAFLYVNKSIPMYVPCGSMGAYQNTDGWNEFTNMVAMCSGEVTVTVNPSEGGTVTGAGYYNGGDLCVLTATPNPGFSFINWTKNGVMVSTDTVYSFYAYPTTIVANFSSNSPIIFDDTNVKMLCVANWDTNGDDELSYAEAAFVTSLGEVFSNQSSISSFDELQFFIGLTSIHSSAFRNCTGLTSIIIPNSVTSIGNWAFYGCSGLTSITVHAETPPTIQSYTFRYVPKSIPVYVPCGSSTAYQSTAYWSEFNNYQEMHCPTEVHFITSGAWSEPTSWQGGALPSQNDIVLIDAPCQLDIDAEVADLTITSGQSLTLQAGKILTVTGTLNNTSAAALVIKDGAQLVNASANVAATMEKNVTAFGGGNPDGWYTISSPMNGMTIEGSGFVTNNYDLYRFNESNLTNEEWENYKGGLADFTTFENGRGYLFANSNAFSPAFTGTLNASAVTCQLSYTERPNDPLSGFNLIGNPFPHDIYKGSGGAIDNANLASGYYTLTNEGTWQVHTFEDAIHPGQGILVKATAPTVLTIAKSNEMASSESGEAKGKTNQLRISVKGDNGQDQTYVYFGQGVGLDKKNNLNGQAPSLWVRANGNDYAIAHVDNYDESLELCFSGKQEGDFTLSVVAGNTKFTFLQLTDRVTGTTVDLLKQPNYSFHATGQEPRARFCIEFRMME